MTTASRPAHYLGAIPPQAPRPFAPPPLTGSRCTLTCLAIAPGVRHVALCAMDAGADAKVAPSIHETTLTGGEWSSPVRVAAFGEHPGGEAGFCVDGRWLHFSSDRPPGVPGRPRAFRAPVENGRIGAPELVPVEIGADAGVYFPRSLPNGDLVFTSPGPVGGDDRLIARARAGGGSCRAVTRWSGCAWTRCWSDR